MCAVLALLFLVVPATEIYVIINVGGLLGVWPTLGVIAVTALVGAALAKSQGGAVLKDLQTSMQNGTGTALALVEGVLVLAAGITLLAPGFITDAIGLLLLVPPFRKVIASHFASNMKVGAGMSAGFVGGFGPGMGAAGSPSGQEDDDPPPPGVIDI